jgi:hypothetical protein
MSNHFLIRRAARTAASAVALTPAMVHSAAALAEAPFALPDHRTVHDPVGKQHILERMSIDTESKKDRITLTVDMEKEDFVLYQVATPDGKVLRSGSWLLAPGPNELAIDAKKWPSGTLELSVLTRKDLMKLDFRR